MHFNQKNIILLVCIGIVTAFVISRIPNQQTQEQAPRAVIDGTTLFLEVANTPERRSKGLGGRTQLTDDYGMLFPFENQPVPPTFWMKGMVIPIDIIWIKDTTIIAIDKNAQPEPGVADYELQRYSPDKPVNYVLEVRAGLSDEKGFSAGDTIRFEEYE